MQHNSWLAIGALILSVISCGVGSLAQTAVPQAALPSSLRWYAGIAKRHGQSSVDLASTNTHDYSPSISESLRKSLLVKGVVITQSVDSSDGFAIFRWYKVRVVSRGPNKPFISNLDHASMPEAAKHLQSNEIMVRVDGGSAVIDDVTITQPGPPALGEGQEYIFLLDKTSLGFYNLGFDTDPIAIKPNGNLAVNSVGNKLFARSVRSYHSYADLQQLALQTK